MTGFQHGRIFKIVNAKDKSAIQLHESVLVTGPVSDKSAKFKTVLVPQTYNQFRVGSIAGLGLGTPVWDYIPGFQYIMLSDLTDSINQIWTTERVYQDHEIVLIKSSDGRCLRSMGNGKKIQLVARDLSDSYQHWQIKPTTSY